MATNEGAWRDAALLGALFLLLVAINPVGYVGGGGDDYYYLDAARRLAAGDWSVPTNPWESRWPAFAPIALLLALVGDGRAAAGAWPLLASGGALFLFWRLARALAGPTAGLLAALLFLAVVDFTRRALMPAPESGELLFLFAGMLALVDHDRTRRPAAMALAGLCFGLAFQLRETAIVGAALVGAYIMLVPRHRPAAGALLAGLGGFLLPLAVEFLAYGLATGDPLWRRLLAVHHARFAASALPSGLDRDAVPFFNPDFIAGWERVPGIKLHWLVDGPLNLALNPTGGTAILLALLIAPLALPRLAPGERRLVARLAAFAALFIALITYALAMNPQPRVMLPALAAVDLALAVMLARLWAGGARLLVATAMGASLLLSLLIIIALPSIRPHEAALARLVAAQQNSIEADETTRRMLSFVPGADRLPGPGSGRPLRLTYSAASCPGDAAQLRTYPLSRVAALLPATDRASLCLRRTTR